jgi:hypothetical protein
VRPLLVALGDIPSVAKPSRVLLGNQLPNIGISVPPSPADRRESAALGGAQWLRHYAESRGAFASSTSSDRTELPNHERSTNLGVAAP